MRMFLDLSFREVIESVEIYRILPNSVYVWIALFCYALFSMTFISIPSYAHGITNETLETEDNSFRSRDIDPTTSSAFDVLQEQERYKDEAKNVFDVTEGNDAVEDKDVPTPPVSHVLQTPIIEETEGSYRKTAKIVAINKITARSKQLSIKTGHSAYFGNIEIFVKKCWNNGDIYLPSNKILVNITENKIDEDAKPIFHGWLISSNIPVSGLQDPSYELIALDCTND